METVPREVVTPPRPSTYDEHVKRVAAEAILPQVLGWLKRNGADYSNDEEERNDVLKDIHAERHQV